MATFVLKLSKRQDPKTGKSEILIRLRHGKTIELYANSGIFIHPDFWNNGIKIPRDRIITDKLRDAQRAKTDFDKLLNLISESFLTADRKRVNSKWMSGVVDTFHKREQEPEPEGLLTYIANFIERAPQRTRHDTGRVLRESNMYQYRATFKHLQEFAVSRRVKDFEFSDINKDFYERFVAHLQKQGFRANSIGKHIKVLKTFVNDAPAELRTQADLKPFRVLREDVDNVYLNDRELEALRSCELPTAKLERVRDSFLLLAWTGCRYSDLSKVFEASGDYILIRQEKTDAKVKIPIHPVVREILNKYQGSAPRLLSNQRFNEYIKEVARIAGIDQVEAKRETIGGKEVATKRPKYELITSHAGRRSFATNMYLAGLPSITIMAITGHKTEKSFMKYLKITQAQHAELVGRFFEKYK